MNAIAARLALAAPPALRRLVSSEHVWSLGDQALVSAASFVSLFLVAHWSDASQVGLYSVALSMLAIFLVFQDSLVLRPYTVQMFSHSGTPQQHSLSALLIAVAMAVAASCAFGLWSAGGGTVFSAPASLGLAVAAALPAIALREFVRRHSFANLLMKRAFLTDLAGVALGLGGLVALGLSGRMGAATAIVTLSWSFAFPSLVCLVASRREYAFARSSAAETMRSGWRVGKWFLPLRLAMEGQGYTIHWVSMAIAGPALTGVYSASLAIVALANPLLIGLLNIMTPRAVRALKEGGRDGLKAQAAGEALTLAVVLTGFVAVIAFAGEMLMGIVFPSKEYEGQALLLLLLALGSSAGWMGAPAAVALQSSGRERIAALISIVAFLACLVLVWTVLPDHGLIGAAIALLCVEAAVTATKWAVFLSTPGKDAGGAGAEGVKDQE
jgi:O-antigen/teichoic acid export membrane protein